MDCPANMRRSKRGITIVEVTAAAAMLAVLLASSAQVMRSLATQQEAAARRAMALQTVEAVLEEFANRPWGELTPTAAGDVTLPEVAKMHLPGASVEATVADVTDPVAAKRLAVEVEWNSPNGQPARPVRLTTWVYSDAPEVADAETTSTDDETP
jgi:Tfp pilus assembly protein PilE